MSKTIILSLLPVVAPPLSWLKTPADARTPACNYDPDFVPERTPMWNPPPCEYLSCRDHGDPVQWTLLRKQRGFDRHPKTKRAGTSCWN